MIESRKLEKGPRQPGEPLVIQVKGSTSSHHSARMAPLASLDCSITEPLSHDSQMSQHMNQPQPHQQQCQKNPLETPTLSGYFDCDQLSDMVDGSLFEITYAGCLSKTVFMASSQSEPQDRGSGLESCDERLESQTADSKPATSSPITPKSQLELLANYQPYDYSSTSRIPLQTRVSAYQSQLSQQLATGTPLTGGANNGSSQRHRAKTARLPAAGGTARLQPSAANSGPGIKGQRSQRKSRSNPDVRDNGDGVSGELGLCSACSEQEASSSRKKDKKRFTFSLFNLFTGGGNGSDSVQQVKRPPCTHRRRSGTASSSSRSASGTGAQGESKRARHVDRYGSQIKSRDSIKLTNQRKLRNNIVKASNSCAELQRAAQTELLLDFPATGEVTAADHQQTRMRASQSHHNIQQTRVEHTGNPSILINKPPQRLAKSVKFTTPDRVLIVPANGRPGELSGLCAGGGRSGGSNQLPPADRQPPVPIIKRPVAKSSAYAQTELNKSLNEMLARYEGNADLIVEINEKLKLTETIASPMSALDRSDDGHLDNGLPAPQASTSAPTSSENNVDQMRPSKPTDRLIEPETLVNDKGSSATTTDAPAEPQRTPIVDLYPCQPDGSIQIVEASDAEEAGFSQNWLPKHRAFV